MSSFQQVLDHIRATSESEAQKGRLFERLIKTYFEQDPLYHDRFASVSLWSDWAAEQYGHALSGPWADFRDCHVRPDLILIYEKADRDILRLVRLGSHAKLGL